VSVKRIACLVGALGLFLALFLAPVRARAALTASELEQVRQLVLSAQVAGAGRARSLVARPDLSVDEGTAALSAGMAEAAFTPQRAAFVRELLFGPASSASRPIVAQVATRALLARANAILSKRAGDLESHPEAVAELSRVYAFLGAAVANAGAPLGLARDASAAIPDSAREACASAVADHVARNPSWLRGDASLSPLTEKPRAQLQLVLVDLMSAEPTRRVDAADRLGLKGARRAVLVELGLLFLDTGRADDAHVAQARALLERLRAAGPAAEGIFFGEGQPGLVSRGQVLGVRDQLEGGSVDAASIWGDDVEPGPLDPGLFAVARDLARFGASRALDNRPGLRVGAMRDLANVQGDARKLPGSPLDASVEEALTSAVALLLADAPRALDLAAARASAGDVTSMAIVTDAMGMLAAMGAGTVTGTDPGQGLTLALGVPKAGGGTAVLPATRVRLAPTGSVVAFTLDAHGWAVPRDDAGALAHVHRDGVPVTIAMLPTARVPVSAGRSWSDSGLVFARLQGSPRAGVAGTRLRIVGAGAKGLDAIVTPAPADDAVVEADVTVRGGPGGVIARATTTADAYKAVGVVLTPGSPPRATLVISDGTGSESIDAGPIDLPPAVSYHVRLAVKGETAEARVGVATLKATLPPGLAHGDVGARAAQGASVDVGQWMVTRATNRGP
jgi:hypothetical protein